MLRQGLTLVSETRHATQSAKARSHTGARGDALGYTDNMLRRLRVEEDGRVVDTRIGSKARLIGLYCDWRTKAVMRARICPASAARDNRLAVGFSETAC